MIAVAAAATAMFAPLIAAPAASADPAPPFVDHVEWAKWGDLSSLRVYPTPAGRQATGLAAPTLADAAWNEVLTLAPDADIPGMKAQFVCHWEFAELGRPGKVSWNLEPWRNEVSDQEMVAAGCNPGGTEEPF
ncbi:DUF2599 domain-containing protein [Mycobacterium deserti]|uniref:DUF2599 domain-containing protein n=1 Tax=Mycobacterium deserti TaxID=2978347 RepID=A0ABT2M8G7_9MYCO|nr:DUF2599 domain-containing protein [Mycobacterium deserti]MCT7658563.1 DUF2599 domain-containing protein [Mycobacterium deserti]